MYAIINSSFSLIFQLVRPHQAEGMKEREMLDWKVVEETYTHQSILCVLHSKGSCISWSRVVVVGSVTFSLGGHHTESACSTGLETSKLPESWCKLETRQASHKSRAWHRELLTNSGRSITKHLQNNIPGGKRRGAVTIIENFTPRTFLEKQQKQMDPVGREENIYLLSCKNSKSMGDFLWLLARGRASF